MVSQLTLPLVLLSKISKWIKSSLEDRSKDDNADVPIVIQGLNTLFGGEAKTGGMAKVTTSTLKNRSAKAVNAVRLKWVLTTTQERSVPLLDGATPVFKAQVPEMSVVTVNIPIIRFLRIAKPLIKDGVLNGDFVVTVRVAEVHFDDGSSWKEGEAVGFLKLNDGSSWTEGGETISFLKASYRSPLIQQTTTAEYHVRCSGLLGCSFF